MKYHQLKCPNCGADLEIEDGINTFFCKFCGTKLLIDQSDSVIQAKVDIRKAEIEADVQKAKIKSDDEQMKRFYRSVIGLFVVGVVLLLIAYKVLIN